MNAEREPSRSRRTESRGVWRITHSVPGVVWPQDITGIRVALEQAIGRRLKLDSHGYRYDHAVDASILPFEVIDKDE